MTMTYEIITSRRTAILYLTREFGIKGAATRLRDLKHVAGYQSLVVLSVIAANMSTQRGARDAAGKVHIFAAYQQGRLGVPLTGGDVYYRPVGGAHLRAV